MNNTTLIIIVHVLQIALHVSYGVVDLSAIYFSETIFNLTFFHHLLPTVLSPYYVCKSLKGMSAET